jgi:hypothetical protein
VTRAWISETVRRNDVTAVRSGSDPDIPFVVLQVTFQCVVTDTGYEPLG